MATREDVLIRFGGDAKGVNSTLASIRTSVSGLSSMLGGLGVGIGVAGLATAFKDTLSWADDLVETADRVGLTTDAIQALRAEANLFGVSAEEVDGALTKFSINLGKARQGTGDLYKVFQQYNQSLSGTATEVLGRYIKLLQNARSEAEQNRIAVAGFGKAGAKMAQSIAESGVPLDQMIAKFRELGLVLDEQGLRKTAELNDAFDTLVAQGGAKFKQWIVDSTSGFTQMWEAFTEGYDQAFIQLSNFDVLFDIGKKIQEQKEAIANLKDGWLSWMFSEAAYNEARKKQEEQLKRLEAERERIIQALAAVRDAAKKKKAETKTTTKTKTTDTDGTDTTKTEAIPGDASKGFKTYTDGLVTARQDAATKSKSITQQQFTYESEILNQYNKEVLALRDGQTEAAQSAQTAQEAAFRKLADVSKGGYALQYYQDLVGQVTDQKPVELQAKMAITVDRTEIDQIPAWMKASLEGQGYTLKVGVIPSLLMGENGELNLGNTPTEAADTITKEVDQTGANP